MKYFIFAAMIIFSHPHIAVATPVDVPEIVALLNSAYRGESSKQGWTTEAHLIGGNVRTSETDLQNVLQLPNSIIAKYTDAQGAIIGCVNLQQHEDKIYLGMLSVSPTLQNGGIGKALLQAGEQTALHLNCTAVYMTVISARQELIEWYQRQGFQDTGERKVFLEDGLSGKHLQPLEFVVLEKVLSASLL